MSPGFLLINVTSSNNLFLGPWDVSMHGINSPCVQFNVAVCKKSIGIVKCVSTNLIIFGLIFKCHTIYESY